MEINWRDTTWFNSRTRELDVPTTATECIVCERTFACTATLRRHLRDKHHATLSRARPGPLPNPEVRNDRLGYFVRYNASDRGTARTRRAARGRRRTAIRKYALDGVPQSKLVRWWHFVTRDYSRKVLKATALKFFWNTMPTYYQEILVAPPGMENNRIPAREDMESLMRVNSFNQ